MAIKEFPCPYGCGTDLPPGDGNALEEHIGVCSERPDTGQVFPPKNVAEEPRNDDEETPS